MDRKHKMKDSNSQRQRQCPVCLSEFVEDLSRPCNHICPSCELILLECPVCIDIINNRAEYEEGDDVVSHDITRERLDQVVGSILVNQKKRSEEGGLPLTAKPAPVPIHTQILKHCFIVVWDGAINCVASTFGLKSTKLNVIARNINNIMLRIGRQTGRSVQPKVCSNLSKTDTVKIIGALAAVLLSMQMLVRRFGSK